MTTVAVVGAAAISAHGASWRGLGEALLARTPLPGIPAETPLANPKARNARKMMSRGAYLAAAALSDLIRDVGWTAEQREAAGYYLGVGASGGSLDDVTALLDASIVIDHLDEHRPGVSDNIFSLRHFGERGLAACNPLLAFQLMNNFTLAHGAIFEGLGGPNGALFSRGGGTTHALIEAVHAIRSGDCDRAIAGGADSATHPVTHAELAREGFVARGLVPAEGAAVLALVAAPPNASSSSSGALANAGANTSSTSGALANAGTNTSSRSGALANAGTNTSSTSGALANAGTNTSSTSGALANAALPNAAPTIEGCAVVAWRDRALAPTIADAVERAFAEASTAATSAYVASRQGSSKPLTNPVAAATAANAANLETATTDAPAAPAAPAAPDAPAATATTPVPTTGADAIDVVVVAPWGPPVAGVALDWVRARFPAATVVDASPLGATLAASPALAWVAALDLLATRPGQRALVIDIGVDDTVGAVLWRAPEIKSGPPEVSV